MAQPIRTIIEIVSAESGVSVADILSDRRSRYVAYPRQDAMLLAKTLTPASLPAIGRVFKRDHTTVLHGIRAAQFRADRDPDGYERMRRSCVMALTSRCHGFFSEALS